MFIYFLYVIHVGVKVQQHLYSFKIKFKHIPRTLEGTQQFPDSQGLLS